MRNRERRIINAFSVVVISFLVLVMVITAVAPY